MIISGCVDHAIELMTKNICSSCVLDDEIKLDLIDGVCQYCRFADDKANERRVMLTDKPWVIYDIKKHAGKDYDCLLGLSGGVDSSYALHRLLKEGIRPLTFSVDNGHQTDIANENIMRMVEGLKVPFYRYNINLERFRELQKAFIKSGVKNIEIPTDHILMATTYEMARKHGIKTIISGGNWQTEGTLPEDYGYSAKDLTHIKAIGDTEGLPTISLARYLWDRNIKGIKIVNLLDYFDYNRTDAIKTLEKEYGYKDYGEKHTESKFTKWFQNSYLPRVWGLDKRKPHLTSLIHSGQITREKALKELKKEIPYDSGWMSNEMGWPKQKHEHSEYPTNEKWERLWIKLFNILKRYGYSR